jgi:DNA-binding PadR family transcriptional regulator
MDNVTHYEATVLSLIQRVEPATAYQIRKLIAESPTTNISNSTGKIYPIVRRLKERGWIAAEAVEDDLRNAERLRCTEAGKQVLRRWVRSLGRTHLLLDDPLRTKILSIGLLSKREQIRWLDTVRSDLMKQQAAIDEFARRYPGPIHDLAHANARMSTAARIAWVDLTLRKLRGQSSVSS